MQRSGISYAEQAVILLVYMPILRGIFIHYTNISKTWMALCA